MVKTVGDAVYLELSRPKPHFPKRFALIDLEDYDRVSKTKWWPCRNGTSFYAEATSIKYLAVRHKKMHSYIMRTEPGEIVDHVNGDTLDNRKQNLRLCTPAENSRNKRRATFPGKTSHFKGVSWDKYASNWQASITLNRECFPLGSFSDEIMAAKAYDLTALEKFGEFARTNYMLGLFDGEQAVPDCSVAAEFDAIVDLPRAMPRKHPGHGTYDQRLTAKLKESLGDL